MFTFEKWYLSETNGQIFKSLANLEPVSDSDSIEKKTKFLQRSNLGNYWICGLTDWYWIVENVWDTHDIWVN